LVIKTLGKFVNKAVEEVFLDGVNISNSLSEGLLISHLFFVNDTLIIFYKPNESNLSYLKCILLVFEAMPGLRANLSRSAIMPIDEGP